MSESIGYLHWSEREITKENFLDAVYDILDDEFCRIEHAHIGGANTGKSYNNIQEIMGHFEDHRENTSKTKAT